MNILITARLMHLLQQRLVKPKLRIPAIESYQFVNHNLPMWNSVSLLSSKFLFY